MDFSKVYDKESFIEVLKWISGNKNGLPTEEKIDIAKADEIYKLLQFLNDPLNFAKFCIISALEHIYPGTSTEQQVNIFEEISGEPMGEFVTLLMNYPELLYNLKPSQIMSKKNLQSWIEKVLTQGWILPNFSPMLVNKNVNPVEAQAGKVRYETGHFTITYDDQNIARYYREHPADYLRVLAVLFKRRTPGKFILRGKMSNLLEEMGWHRGKKYEERFEKAIQALYYTEIRYRNKRKNGDEFEYRSRIINEIETIKNNATGMDERAIVFTPACLSIMELFKQLSGNVNLRDYPTDEAFLLDVWFTRQEALNQDNQSISFVKLLALSGINFSLNHGKERFINTTVKNGLMSMLAFGFNAHKGNREIKKLDTYLMSNQISKGGEFNPDLNSIMIKAFRKPQQLNTKK